VQVWCLARPHIITPAGISGISIDNPQSLPATDSPQLLARSPSSQGPWTFVNVRRPPLQPSCLQKVPH